MLSPRVRVADQPAWQAPREAAWQDLVAFFGAAPERRPTLHVWRSSDEAVQAGLRPLGFAVPEHALVHLHKRQTRGHELTHIAVRELVQPSLIHPLVNEGLAVLFGGTDRDRLATARAWLEETPVPPPLWEGLWAVDGSEDLNDAVAALVMERLLERGGRERFLRLLECQSQQTVALLYGDAISGWIAELEVDLGLRAGPCGPRR